VIATYNIDVYSGGAYVDGSTSNLATRYFDGTNPWSADSLYATYSSLDLTGYTLVYVQSASAPTVTTPTSASVTASTATLGGNVTSDGAATVTARGVVYAPTATNSNPRIGGTGVTSVAGTGTTGVFTVAASSLTAGTAYTFAAYATNAVGTTYSSTGTFTTSAASGLTLTVSSFTRTSITLTIGGTIPTATIGDQKGWLAIKNRWQTNTGTHNEWFSGTPTVSACSVIIGGVTYTTNTTNIGASDAYNFGDCVYFRNTSQTVAFAAGTAASGSVTLTLSSTESFTNNVSLDLLSGFSVTTNDWVRLEANATASYLDPVTGAASSVTTTAAALSGTANTNGYSAVVGFEYGPTTGYGSSATAAQSPLTSATAANISANLSGLSAGTTYHYRAYITYDGSTSYGSDATFTTVALPAISSVSPSIGSPGGGTSVTITGTNFTGATAVKFGSTNATSFTVDSATQITATAPAGSTGIVDITVTTSGGTSATGVSDRFTYLSNATISSVSAPSNASYKAGANLDFTVNFTAAVTVNGTPVLALTIGSAPALATYLSGSGTSAVVFRYTVAAGDTDTNGIAVS
jgi:hypothetical protein